MNLKSSTKHTDVYHYFMSARNDVDNMPIYFLINT